MALVGVGIASLVWRQSLRLVQMMLCSLAIQASSDDLTRDRGTEITGSGPRPMGVWLAPELASLSANSLPKKPECPGIQLSVTEFRICLNLNDGMFA